MSRRQRNNSNKKSASPKRSSGKFKGLWWKVLLCIIVILLIGGIIAYNKVVAFLHSDGLREQAAEQVSAELGMEGELGEFTWSGLSGKNESFNAIGDGFFGAVDVKDISFDVTLNYIKRDKFRVKNISIASVYSEVDIRKPFEKIELPKKKKSFLASLLPQEVEVLDAKIYDVNSKVVTDSGEFIVNGMGVSATKENDTYKVLLDRGRLTLPFPFLNSAELVKGEILLSDDEVYVENTKLKIFKHGEVLLDGVVDLSPRSKKMYDMDGVLSGLRCSDVFPKNWGKHLTGEVKGKFKIRPKDGMEPKIEGNLEILDGQLRALPVLDKMAQYFSTDYRTIDFQEFTCDFMKYKDLYQISNLRFISDGLIQVEGGLKIDGMNVDGIVNVGLPSKNLSKLPGARGNVFKLGKDGLYWAQIKIGGSFGNITNDLKDRLVQAAIDAGIEDLFNLGKGVLDPETATKLLNLGVENGVPLDELPEMLKSDNGLIKGGIEGGGEILKGLLKGVTEGNSSGSGSWIPGFPLPKLSGDKEAENTEEDSDPESDSSGLPIPIPDLKELPKIPSLPLPF